MKKIDELGRIANKEDITVMTTNCPECGSMSHMTLDGNCYIGIDRRKMTEAEKTVYMAHEMGHCMTGSFYNRYSRFDVISRHEYRANKWAIKKLVPEDELIEAFENGIIEIWELAERFDVTEDFMKKACEFYGYYQGAV